VSLASSRRLSSAAWRSFIRAGLSPRTDRDRAKSILVALRSALSVGAAGYRQSETMTTGRESSSGSERAFTGRRLVLGALVLAVVAAFVFGAASAYARSQDDDIANGIHAGAIDLGGLSASAAHRRIQRAFAPLERPLLLRYPRGRLVLSARAARAGVREQGERCAGARSQPSLLVPPARVAPTDRQRGERQPAATGRLLPLGGRTGRPATLPE